MCNCGSSNFANEILRQNGRIAILDGACAAPRGRGAWMLRVTALRYAQNDSAGNCHPARSRVVLYTSMTYETLYNCHFFSILISITITRFFDKKRAASLRPLYLSSQFHRWRSGFTFSFRFLSRFLSRKIPAVCFHYGPSSFIICPRL